MENDEQQQEAAGGEAAAEQAAVVAEQAAEQPAEQSAEQAGGESFSPDELEDAASTPSRSADINLDLVLEVPVTVSLQVGSTEITIRDLVQLVEGSVVALDREASEPLDVLVNGTLIAHGEIVVVDDAFGVRLTDVISPAERIKNLN